MRRYLYLFLTCAALSGLTRSAAAAASQTPRVPADVVYYVRFVHALDLQRLSLCEQQTAQMLKPGGLNESQYLAMESAWRALIRRLDAQAVPASCASLARSYRTLLSLYALGIQTLREAVKTGDFTRADAFDEKVANTYVLDSEDKLSRLCATAGLTRTFAIISDAPSARIEEFGWSRTSAYSSSPVHWCKATGVLRNCGQKTYRTVQVTVGVFDAKTNAKVAVQKAVGENILPGERWQFTCLPSVALDSTANTHAKYRARVDDVTVWE